MTNYEKLCEAAGVNYIAPIQELPIFEAEKQIELIKLIGTDSERTPLCLKQDQSKNWHCYCYQYNGEENEDFAEALAGLVLQLIEAGELDKDEIRKVLA